MSTAKKPWKTRTLTRGTGLYTASEMQSVSSDDLVIGDGAMSSFCTECGVGHGSFTGCPVCKLTDVLAYLADNVPGIGEALNAYFAEKALKDSDL